MKTLLIIGGSGFFGKSFLDSFKQGQLEKWGIGRIIAMSRHAEQLNVDVPQLISNQVELLSADIATTDAIPYADIVIHAAASTDASKYLSQGIEERNNIQAGILNYCQLAKKFHVKSKILYVSSGAVYGNQPPDLSEIAEDYVASNLTQMHESKINYAHAKRDAEAAVRELASTGMNASIARCFAFVGPWLPRQQHFAVGNFIEDGLQGRPISVKANHAVYRSYMHADDLIHWLMTIAHHSNTNCPEYNVGSDQPVLMGELAELIANEFQTTAHILPLNRPQVDRYVPSIKKAYIELGLTLKYDLKAAIQKTINAINN